MFNLLMFVISLLVFFAVWKGIFRPAFLGYTRDKIFVIRDIQLRQFCVDNNIPLDDPAYKATRKMLNTYLRFVVDISMSIQVVYGMQLDKNPEVLSAIKKRKEAEIFTSNKAFAEQIENIRKQAALIVQEYLVLSSLPAIALLVFVISKSLLRALLKRVFSQTARIITSVDDATKTRYFDGVSVKKIEGHIFVSEDIKEPCQVAQAV